MRSFIKVFLVSLLVLYGCASHLVVKKTNLNFLKQLPPELHNTELTVKICFVLLSETCPEPDTTLYYRDVDQSDIINDFVYAYPPDDLIINIVKNGCVFDSATWIQFSYLTNVAIPFQIAGQYFFFATQESYESHRHIVIKYYETLLKYRIYETLLLSMNSVPAKQAKAERALSDAFHIARTLSRLDAKQNCWLEYLNKLKQTIQPDYFYDRVES